MSLARRQRLVLNKRRKQVAVLYTRCAVCEARGRPTVLAAKTKPLLVARLHEHYQRAHPDVIRSGGLPVLQSRETNG